jgi:CRISP-associated protein Cas1
LFRQTGVLEKLIPAIEEILRSSGLEPPAEAPDAVDAEIPRDEASGDDGHRG